MNRSLKFFTLFILLQASPALKAQDVWDKFTPQWAKKSQISDSGKIRTIITYGEGTDEAVARQEAMQSCKASAIERLQTSFSSKSVTIQTETDVALHEEHLTKAKFEGIECLPQTSTSKELDGVVRFWVKCRCDLSKAKQVNDDTSVVPENSLIKDAAVLNRDDLERLTSAPLIKEKQADIESTVKVIVIGVMPSCDKLLVRGERPRVLKCDQNPMSVKVDDEDREIIIHKKKYLPKTIRLGKIRENEVINVLLEEK